MKYCLALILSFLSLSLFALAGFEVTEYNGVRKENLEFSTVLLRQDWQYAPISSSSFRKSADCRKTADEQVLAGKWLLPDGEFLLKHRLKREGENTLRLSFQADCADSGVAGRTVMVSTAFPVLEFGSRAIRADGKNISFSRKQA